MPARCYIGHTHGLGQCKSLTLVITMITYESSYEDLTSGSISTALYVHIQIPVCVTAMETGDQYTVLHLCNLPENWYDSVYANWTL